MKKLGFHGGYQYPHDFEGKYVEQQYLPDELQGRRYYEPTESGDEATVRARLQAILDRRKPPF
jgi:putative ATPase